MQLHQPIKTSRNVIDLLAPSAETTELPIFQEFFEFPARKRCRAVTGRSMLPGRDCWASPWEDASFAAIGAAGLAAVGLALRVLS